MSTTSPRCSISSTFSACRRARIACNAGRLPCTSVITPIFLIFQSDFSGATSVFSQKSSPFSVFRFRANLATPLAGLSAMATNVAQKQKRRPTNVVTTHCSFVLSSSLPCKVRSARDYKPRRCTPMMLNFTNLPRKMQANRNKFAQEPYIILQNFPLQTCGSPRTSWGGRSRNPVSRRNPVPSGGRNLLWFPRPPALP